MAGDGNEAVQGLPGTDVAQPEGDPPIVGPQANLWSNLPREAFRRGVPHCGRNQPLPHQMKPQLTGVEAAAAGTMEALLGLDYTRKELGQVMPRVRKAMAARQAMGRKHYGMTLAENHAAFDERVRMAWEEALDGLAYSEWMLEGWKFPRPEEPEFNRSGRDYPAGVALECMKLFGRAIVELDQLMRAIGMDPVRKEGQP
jgi:hypothetical protein